VQAPDGSFGYHPGNGKRYRSEKEKSISGTMENKRVIILGILLFFIICIILMTLWLAGRLH
jgi:hypothetical protein